MQRVLRGKKPGLLKLAGKEMKISGALAVLYKLQSYFVQTEVGRQFWKVFLVQKELKLEQKVAKSRDDHYIVV